MTSVAAGVTMYTVEADRGRWVCKVPVRGFAMMTVGEGE